MTNDPQKNSSTWTRGIVFAVGLLSTALIGMALFHSTGVSAQLAAWKLLPTPEGYTELYFNQNLTLPVTLAELTGRPVAFSFNIHNQEGRLMEYPYTVMYTNASGVSQKLALGSVVLADGAVQRIEEKITVPAGATAKSEISVILPDQQEEIHFWVGNNQ